MKRQYYMKASKKESDDSEQSEDQQVCPRFSEVKEVDERRHKVLTYMKMGYGIHDICKTLDESPQTIRNDMDKIRDMALEARDEDLDVVRTETIEAARVLRSEAYAGYQRSKGVVTETKTKEGEKGGKAINEKTEKKTELIGDPRFIAEALKANEQIAEFSGAKRHKDMMIQNNQQNNVIHYESPERAKVPEEYDRWTKKPEDAESHADVDVAKEVEEPED